MIVALLSLVRNLNALSSVRQWNASEHDRLASQCGCRGPTLAGTWPQAGREKMSQVANEEADRACSPPAERVAKPGETGEQERFQNGKPGGNRAVAPGVFRSIALRHFCNPYCRILSKSCRRLM